MQLIILTIIKCFSQFYLNFIQTDIMNFFKKSRKNIHTELIDLTNAFDLFFQKKILELSVTLPSLNMILQTGNNSGINVYMIQERRKNP